MTDNGPVPLVVDLDGTLIASDLLVESAFQYAGRKPFSALRSITLLLQGRAQFKRKLARETEIDAATLPYNEIVLARIRSARASEGRVYLASASDERFVRAVAVHLGCFDGVFASDGTVNLSGGAKAARLTREFGAKGFDYIGNGNADIPVWLAARTAILFSPSPAMVRWIHRSGERYETLSEERRNWRSWITLLRPHQWVKNALVAVPLLTAHQFTFAAAMSIALAFSAFCLCASGVYVVNDLVDIEADRQHPTKRLRPFASGAVPVLGGIALAPLLTAAAFGLSLLLPLQFTLVLCAYFALTVAYSLSLKRKMLIDAVALAGLYTIRVMGGAAAIGVPVSQWLLGFSVFLFLALALIKRYSEMAMRADAGLPDPTNRDYKATDLPVIAALAAAAGYSAVIVFSLYLSSDAVRALYRHPNVLWLACPILIYWISRMLMLSHRRLMNDDPIVFALKDGVSLATVVLLGILGFAAL